jgi:thymidylate synthase (FAD)
MYCNYSKDKFGGEISYIMPSWFPKANVQQKEAFMQIMKATEDYYMALLGQWDERKPDARFKTGFKDNPLTPQQARQVLPNALKTEVCMTGFASDWRFFFDLRYYGETGKPHPDMELLASKARSEFMKAGLWDDIMSYPSKFEHE